MDPFWKTVAQTPATCAVAAEWRDGMGDSFDTCHHLFQLSPDQAKVVPCPRKCGCAHDVTIGPGEILAVRRNDMSLCHILQLKPEDVELWELNRPKFARALCTAFGFASKFEQYGTNTFQIGTWSADAVPVFLTIQCDGAGFRHVVASLVADQQEPFILLAPTAAHMDATSQRYLTSVGAEFFSLETTLDITDHGTFQPKRLPGEIFARFRPEPQEKLDEDEARRVFAILVKLHSLHPPTVITVLLMYCKEELSAEQVAKECGCSKITIIRRLKIIRAQTGTDPRELRRLSVHLEKIKEDMEDSRASNINVQGAIYGDEFVES